MARGVHVRVGRRASSFYFTPGVNPSSGLSELWQVAADGLSAAKVWEDPTAGNFIISALAHSTATGKLHIFGEDFAAGPWREFGVDIYRLDPATNAVAHFAGPYDFTNNSFSLNKPATHAAEYGGLLYVAHQGGHDQEGGYVTSLDPTSGAVALLQAPSWPGFARAYIGAGGLQPNGWTGGLGVAGGVLYWTDGVSVYAGTGGGLSLAYQLSYPDPVNTFDRDGFGAAGSPVSNPLDGEWYIPGQYAGDETDTSGYTANRGINRQIQRADGSVAFAPAATGVGASYQNRVACMTVLYDADDRTPLQLFALDDGVPSVPYDPAVPLYVWKRTAGVWSAEIDLHAFNPGLRGGSCAMKSFKGALYAAARIQLSDGGFGGTQLYKRTGGGIWSLFADFPGYTQDVPAVFPPPLPVARVSAAIKCHEM